MTRTRRTLITLLAAATVLPGIAAAEQPIRRGDDRVYDRDDRRDTGHHWRRGGYERGNVRWTRLGVVGTHVREAEDFLHVRTRQRFEQLALVADGHPVRMDGLEVQFADGRRYRIPIRETLHPGESITLDVPSYSPVNMVILDYGNRGRTYRGRTRVRETASVEVIGLRSSFRDRGDRRSDRYRGDRRRDPRDRYDDRFRWRGDVYIRAPG